MIKRTIEISRRAAHLSVKLDQLIVQPFDEPKTAQQSIPCEDIGVLLVDHPAAVYTHQALAALMEHGAAVVVCGRDHVPAGLLLPLSTHTEVAWRIREQIAASAPTRKRLWRQIVVAKVRAQAANHPQDAAAQRKLAALSRQVKSGDTSNVEAQAARVYWDAWRRRDDDLERFRRDAANAAQHPLNVLLNYGYTVMRAAIARALVSAGLFPALGIHHCNRANAFCLADDLVEPLRPIVDRCAFGLYGRGGRALDAQAKKALLELLTCPVVFDDQTGPLMVVLHRYVASFARCLSNEEKILTTPVAREGAMC